VCDLGGPNIYRINPADDVVDLTKMLVGSGGHYSYSDMTGIVVRNITTKIGTLAVVHDSNVPTEEWGTVTLTAEEPEGTGIKVEIRAADDAAGLDGKPFATVENGVSLCASGL